MNTALAGRAGAPRTHQAGTCYRGAGLRLGGWTQHLHNPVQIPYSELAGFPKASVAGHSGVLWLGQLSTTLP